MVQSSINLACHLMPIYSIPTTYTLPGVQGHNDMPGVNKDCPGPVPWATWFAGITSCSNQAVCSQPNDACSSANTITVNGNCENGDLCGATQSLAPTTPCGLVTSAYAQDIWYSFNATQIGNYAVTVSPSSAMDAVVNVRSSCTGSALFCLNSGGGLGIPESGTFSISTLGTYYIRVYHYTPYHESPVDATFTICLTGPGEPSCQNDQYESNNSTSTANQTAFYSQILSDLSIPAIDINATICDGDADFYQFRSDHKGMAIFTVSPPQGKNYRLAMYRRSLGLIWSPLTGPSDVVVSDNTLKLYRNGSSLLSPRNYAIKVSGAGANDFSASPYELTMAWCPDCLSSNNRLITSVSIAEGEQIDYCPGQTTTLSASGGGAEYQWFSTEPFTCLNSSCSSIEVAPSSSALYTVVSILSGQGLCSSIDSIFVTYNSNCIVTCYTPTGLSENNLTQTSAFLNWANATGANGYTVQYRINGTSTWSTKSVSSSDATLTGLTCGQTYQWQVRSECSGGIRSSYTALRIFQTNSCSGSNGDNCSSAITLISNGTGCTYTFATVAGASPSSCPQVACDSYSGNPGLADVWFRFQAQATSHTINIDPEGTGTGTNFLDPVVAIYNSCSSCTPRHCEDDIGAGGGFTSVYVTNLTVGNFYYIRIYDYGTSQPANPGFYICVSHTAGDNCSGAISLTSNNSCIPFTSTVAGATSSGLTIPGCSGFPASAAAYDVWFSFQALSTTHTILVDPEGVYTGSSNNNYVDPVIGIYNACNGVLLQCEDDAGGGGGNCEITVNNLTIGNIYLIRVFDYGANPPIFGGFNICITHTGGIDCDEPDDTEEEYIDNDEADLNWSGPSGADYTLRYREDGGGWEYVYPTVSRYNLTGLQCDEEYEWQVRTDCSNGISSDFTNSEFFMTEPCCEIPNNPHENNVGIITAELDWSGVSSANSYKLRYRESGGSWQYEYPSSDVVTIKDLFCGTTYEWEVRSECDNGEHSDYTSTETFTTDSEPLQPGQISGNTQVCEGSYQTYSINTVEGSTTYTWSFPNDWSGSSNGTAINLIIGTSGGNISVTANSSCANSPPQTLNVSVTSNCDDADSCTLDYCEEGVCLHTIITAPNKPDTIYSSNGQKVCPGDIKEYSVTPVPFAEHYVWTSPAGGTIISGIGTFAITIEYGNVTTTSQLSVVAVNSCGSGPAAIIEVKPNYPLVPSIITGQTSGVCDTTLTYSVTEELGMTYLWYAPKNSSIVGQGSNSVEVTFNPGFTFGTLGVKAENACGKSYARKLIINSVLERPFSITGPIFGNCNSESEYAVSPMPGADSYQWSTNIPGANISVNPPPNDIVVTVTFTDSFHHGNISVVAINDCGSSPQRNLTVYGTMDSHTGTVTGNIYACAGDTEIYSIDSVAGAIGYAWSVPSGSTILSGQGTNTIEVLIGNNRGNITVRIINECGIGAPTGIKLRMAGCPSNKWSSDLESNEQNSFEITLFPNPAKNILNLSVNSSIDTKARIEFFDLLGKSIFDFNLNVTEGTTQKEISVKGLPAGLYFLRYRDEMREEVFRVVVQD